MEIDFARPYFDDAEREAVVKVMEGHWLASGPENAAFEKEFAEYVGVDHALCVNSGSAGNLLALASLGLRKGSRVMTSGCGFPATLNPILHLGFEPLLLDYDLRTHNIDLEQAAKNIGKVDAVIVAHTMGSPVDMRLLREMAGHFGVYVVEDCCEAVGASIDGKQVGAWGDCGTFSFYPSHQITALGGGGMVTFRDKKHYERAKSMRDWGKIPSWDTGRNQTVYSTNVGGVPYFPHYTYQTVGHNMKLPEANAAFGREQLKRLDWIVAERNRIHDYIAPKVGWNVDVVKGAIPSWFGVCLTHPNRDKVGLLLEGMGVGHRPFFAGNITKHEPYKQYAGNFPVADWLMRHAYFIGCWAGMTQEQMDYIVSAINEVRDS